MNTLLKFQEAGFQYVVDYMVPHGHVCISVSERLELLRDHLNVMGDDEIRFHICDLLDSRNNLPASRLAMPTEFLFLDTVLWDQWWS